jgi:hypothetical protein
MHHKFYYYSAFYSCLSRFRLYSSVAAPDFPYGAVVVVPWLCDVTIFVTLYQVSYWLAAFFFFFCTRLSLGTVYQSQSGNFAL